MPLKTIFTMPEDATAVGGDTKFPNFFAIRAKKENGALRAEDDRVPKARTTAKEELVRRNVDAVGTLARGELVLGDGGVAHSPMPNGRAEARDSKALGGALQKRLDSRFRGTVRGRSARARSDVGGKAAVEKNREKVRTVEGEAAVGMNTAENKGRAKHQSRAELQKVAASERGHLGLRLGKVDADVAGESVDKNECMFDAERLAVDRFWQVNVRRADDIDVRDLARLRGLVQRLVMRKTVSARNVESRQRG